MGFTNVRIKRDLIEEYGPTKGCLGCKYVRKDISYYQGQYNCRKRFLDMSNQAGNETLKSRLDQSFERATRKYLEAGDQGNVNRSDKRAKTQGTRSSSKQQS